MHPLLRNSQIWPYWSFWDTLYLILWLFIIPFLIGGLQSDPAVYFGFIDVNQTVKYTFLNSTSPA